MMHKVTLVSMLCLAWRRKLISASLAQPIHTLQTSHRQLPEHDDLKYKDVIEVRYPCSTLTENAIPCRGIHPMHPSSCHNKRKSQSQTTKSYIIPIQTPLKGSTAWPRLPSLSRLDSNDSLRSRRRNDRHLHPATRLPPLSCGMVNVLVVLGLRRAHRAVLSSSQRRRRIFGSPNQT